MTLLARNTSFHVALVIKLKIVRHYVNLNPRDWLAALVVLFDLLDVFLALFALSLNEHTMTSHTGLNLWNSRVRRLSYRPVAVLTFHLVLLNVNNMAKVDRLLWLIASCALWWTKIMKMVPYIEIPESSLAVVVHTSTNVTSLRVVRGWSCPALRNCRSSNISSLQTNEESRHCQNTGPRECESDFVYHG